MIGGRNLLGAGVDPNAFKYDFSGAYEIGKAYARGIEGAAQGVSQAIGAVGDYFKGQNEKKKLIKQSGLQIDAAIQLFPDLAGPLQSAKDRIRDENIPLSDRAAEAEVAASIVNMGINEMRNRATISIEREKMAADQAYRQATIDVQAAGIGARQQEAQQKAQVEAAKRTEGEISIFDPDTNEIKKERVWKDQFGNAYDWDTKRPIIDTEKYFRREPGGMGEPPPTSQYDSTGISNALSMVGTPDVQIKSSIPKVNIPYNGVPAPNRYNNPGGAYPSEKFLKYGLAGKGIIGGGHPVGYYPNLESGIAANMAHFRQMKPVGKTVGEMRHYWTKGKWGGRTAQPGMDTDEVITQEKLNDPEWMGQWMRTTAAAEGFKGRIPDEKIASGFKFYQSGGVPQGQSQASAPTQDQNLSNSITRVGEIIPEVGTSVLQGQLLNKYIERRPDYGNGPGKLSKDVLDYGIIKGNGKAASEINPEIIQRLIPLEQQAEIARQIEQGSGRATAQASGGMPTEPSIAQPRPNVPRNPISRGVPVGDKDKGTIMTQEQVAQIEATGRKVYGVPLPDGNFRVTSTATKDSGNVRSIDEELKLKRNLALDEEQSKMRAAGVSDAQNVSKFNELLGMLDTGTKTGFGREFLMKAKKVVGGNVADEEDFIARTGEIAMTNIDLTKGAISDREMEYFKTDLSPNIGKTVEGNKRVIQFKLKYAQRSAKIAKTISEMQKQNASPYDIQSKIDEILASDSLVPTGGGEGGSVNQAESDASFIRGFQGAD